MSRLSAANTLQVSPTVQFVSEILQECVQSESIQDGSGYPTEPEFKIHCFVNVNRNNNNNNNNKNSSNNLFIT